MSLSDTYPGKYYPQDTLDNARERFLSKIPKNLPDNECWNWAGTLSDGRGLFNLGKGFHQEKASRLAWIYFRGTIPKGLFVLHTCDNGRCVNPNHLYLGTHSQNMHDAYDRKRHDQHGEKSKHNKLKTAEVYEIRRLYATGKVNQPTLGKMFRVTRSAIEGVVCNFTWKHLLEGDTQL